MKKVILFNGPPYSGKDTLGDAVISAARGAAVKLKFAEPLKRGVHASFGLDCDVNYFEFRKDIPAAEFMGVTPRQAYIAHSESYLKLLYGKDIFGKIAANRVLYIQEPIIVVTDSGFYDEAMSVINVVGAQNVLLIHVMREGKTFDGDSRSYIDLPGVMTLQIKNQEGKVEDTVNTVLGYVNSFVNS